jgi:hypothetical protein
VVQLQLIALHVMTFPLLQLIALHVVTFPLLQVYKGTVRGKPNNTGAAMKQRFQARQW